MLQVVPCLQLCVVVVDLIYTPVGENFQDRASVLGQSRAMILHFPNHAIQTLHVQAPGKKL